jgi:hypothetical protein
MIPSEKLSRVLELYHTFCCGIVMSFATVNMLFCSRLLSAFSAVAVATSNTNTNPKSTHEERISRLICSSKTPKCLLKVFSYRVED